MRGANVVVLTVFHGTQSPSSLKANPNVPSVLTSP